MSLSLIKKGLNFIIPTVSILIATPCYAGTLDLFSSFNNMTQTFSVAGGSQLTCSKSTGEYTYYTEISLGCNFSFNANGYGVSWTEVGKWQWIDSWFTQTWYGKPNTYYDFSMRTTATGTVDTRGWNGQSEARLAIHDLFNSKYDVVTAKRSAPAWWTSDTEYLSFNSQSYWASNLYSGISGYFSFGMGAWIAGWGSIIGAGYNQTSGSLSFTNTVTIAQSRNPLPGVDFGQLYSTSSSYDQTYSRNYSSGYITNKKQEKNQARLDQEQRSNTIFTATNPIFQVEKEKVPEPSFILSLLSLLVGAGALKVRRK